MNPLRLSLFLGRMLLFGSLLLARHVSFQGQPEVDNQPFTLGNPASAWTADDSVLLLTKPTYAVLYSARTNTALFSAWHLSTQERGPVKRFLGGFQPEPFLPLTWYHPHESDYTGTGFDRGHLCPSDDRTASVADNLSTFCLSNVVPQAPLLNRQTWEHLEAYCRAQVDAGFECYIVAGTYGESSRMAHQKIVVPAYCWKVVLVFPEGDHDLARIDASAQVIAVWMPNQDSVAGHDWTDYRTTIRSIERTTGLNFFSLLPQLIQDELENRN